MNIQANVKFKKEFANDHFGSRLFLVCTIG